jgi:putative peptidoglycan lipid II flippase
VILVAGAVQLLVQLPVLARYGVRLRLSFSWRDERVKKVLLLMLPAALGMGVFQINTMIDRLLALAVSDWAAAALRFSERLIYLPLGLFATALSTVLLPTFSRQAARSDTGDMRKTLNFSLRALMLVTIPAAIGLLVLAHPIVRLIFEWGEFNSESTLQTARALVFYAPGLLVFSLHKALVPAFYALKDTRTTVVVGVWAVLLNLALNIIFVITWPSNFKHAGLAFATVISSAVNCIALGVLLHRRIGSPGWRHLFWKGAGMLVAGCVMGTAAWYVHSLLADLVGSLEVPAKTGQLIAVVGSVAAAMLAYFVVAAVFCRSELRALAGALLRGAKRKAGKAN